MVRPLLRSSASKRPSSSPTSTPPSSIKGRLYPCSVNAGVSLDTVQRSRPSAGSRATIRPSALRTTTAPNPALTGASTSEVALAVHSVSPLSASSENTTPSEELTYRRLPSPLTPLASRASRSRSQTVSTGASVQVLHLSVRPGHEYPITRYIGKKAASPCLARLRAPEPA